MENAARGWEEQHLLREHTWGLCLRGQGQGAQPTACCKLPPGPAACPCQTGQVPHATAVPRGHRSLGSRQARGRTRGCLALPAAGTTSQGSVYLRLCWKRDHTGFNESKRDPLKLSQTCGLGMEGKGSKCSYSETGLGGGAVRNGAGAYCNIKAEIFMPSFFSH